MNLVPTRIIADLHAWHFVLNAPYWSLSIAHVCKKKKKSMKLHLFCTPCLFTTNKSISHTDAMVMV